MYQTFESSCIVVMGFYKDKSISKEDPAQTLRAYQASINGMKSKDRDDAKAMQE